MDENEYNAHCNRCGESVRECDYDDNGGLCGGCKDRGRGEESRRYECPVCERKVTIVPDTICSDCFGKGASAMARRF